MQTRPRLFYGLAALLFLPLPSLAAGWTDYAPVSELNPTTQGRFIVKINVSENPSGCRNKKIFYQDYSVSGHRQMFDTFLAAITSGKMVRVFVTGRCELKGYSEISGVSVIP